MRSPIIHLRSFPLLLVMLFLAPPVWAQVVVERSSDRIVISGVTYFLHIVKKGETVYSVSRAYGITSEELIKENPPAVNGLKEGQSISHNSTSVAACTGGCGGS
jgi:LysM domain